MIKIWIHPNIARLAGERTEWEFQPQSDEIQIDELLRHVFANERNLLFGLIDETGSLRKHLNIFIDDANIRQLNGLNTLVSSKNEISIFTAVSGG